MQQKKWFFGTGAIILMTVLIIINILVFAVLTFANSNTEIILAEKNTANQNEFYLADSIAEMKLKELCDYFNSGGDITNLNGNEYSIEKTGDFAVIGYNVNINEQKNLQVRIEFQISENNIYTNPKRLIWQVQTV